jgi:hypothetical protein
LAWRLMMTMMRTMQREHPINACIVCNYTLATAFGSFCFSGTSGTVALSG